METWGTTMSEQILNFLKTEDKAFSVTEIYDGLGLKTVDEFKQLLKELNELEDNL